MGDDPAVLRLQNKVRVPVKAFPGLALLPPALALALAGCAGRGELDGTGGVSAVRSACPVVGVPAGTGDVTLFTGATPDAAAIDVAAVLTEVRSTCTEVGDQIATAVTFRIDARRGAAGPARDLTLPYFLAIVRGGGNVAAKRVGQAVVHFDAGQLRASTPGQATATVARSAATLPADIRNRITRRRKAGDEDAATDPLTQPEIRQAVQRASFEALVGFQLTDAQLRYNAQR